MTQGPNRPASKSRQSRSIEDSRENQASAPRPAVHRLIDPVRNRLWLACGFQAISAAIGVIPFIALAELGRLLLSGGPVDAERAWLIVIMAAAALALRLVFMMVAGGITHLADLDLQLDLRRSMANRLASAPLGWFTERSAGAVKKALQDDVTALHHLVGHSYINTVSALVTPIVALGYLLWVDWRLALAALIPLALGLGLYVLQYRGYGEKIGAYQESLEGVNKSAIEFVQGIAVVKTFGQARQAFGRFIERTNAFTSYFWNWMRGLVALSAASEVVLSPLFSLFTVLASGLALMATGYAEPIDVIPVAILAPALTAPVLTLSYAQNDMVLARDAAERIGEVMDTPVLAAPSVPRTRADARVTFDNVWFSFDGETNALQDINLVLEPGTITALVGPSGSGKSTLASLVPRFWDPTRGEVAVGGVPVSGMTPDALYASVSFVFQTVQLLRGTIAENIAMGRPNASIDEIHAAAKRAYVHDTLLNLPEGYDTVVGAGAHLSGGEAQRVSLARALLADCPVLVLDEATAFLDPEAEASIQMALSDLMADRTVLVIAHRLHTITNVDQICVLQEGRIIERGRHADLLALTGLYERMWTASEAALQSNAAFMKS